MGVNSLPKTDKTGTRQRRGCDLNPGPPAPESSTLTTPLQYKPDRFPLSTHYSQRLYSHHFIADSKPACFSCFIVFCLHKLCLL